MWGQFSARHTIGVFAMCLLGLTISSCNDKGEKIEPCVGEDCNDTKPPPGKGDGCDVIAETCHANAKCVEPANDKDDAICQCHSGYRGNGKECEAINEPKNLPVGSPCDRDTDCAGPGEAICLIEELAPLASLVQSSNVDIAGIADSARVLLPNNYCSTVAPCSTDNDCGEGGTCFLPLIDVDSEEYEDLIKLLSPTEEELATFVSFNSYGVCLQACESDDECERPGYQCDVPLGGFVGILRDSGARMETYCIGDPTCDGCSPDATCEDSGEEFEPVVCTCNDGFEGDGYTCTPTTPECEPECDDNATCLIADDGNACDCNEGFEGDGLECDPIACDPACGDNAICVDDACECEETYEGDPLEGCTPIAVIDACDPNPCQNDGTCTEDDDAEDGFTCACTDDFEGTLCDTPIETDDACDPNPCQNDGTCTEDDDAEDGFTCACTDDFEGDRCETPIATDACEDTPCLNGECTDLGEGEFSCECDSGWNGDLCDDEVDACDAEPCAHGTCGPTGPGEYACECDSGWMGTDCDQEVNGCEDDPCENGGTCNDEGAGEISCSCPDGFEGDLCQTEINACDDNPCENGGTCEDKGAGDFACACADGYEGTTCADEIDACEDEPCANGSCDPTTPGNYVCQCDEWYDGVNCDEEILACDDNPCANGECSRTGVGTYSCECDDNWGGTNCDQPVSGCEDDPCQNGGSCIDGSGPGEYTCECPDGYEGNTCGTPIDLCAKGEDTCENGTCQTTGPGEFACDCAFGWEGADCDVAINSCDATPCQNGGTCASTGPGTHTCDCPTGYTGDSCEIEINGCDAEPCANGSCVNEGAGAYTCDCEPGFEGATCADEIDACLDLPCENGGVCGPTGPGTYICDCPTGFSGDNCEIEANGCDAEPCENGGTCTNEGAGDYTCDCPTGFSGDNCEIEANGCDPDPCVHGSCTNEGAGDYTCDCDAGYIGDNCDEEDGPVAGTCVLSYTLNGTMDILDTQASAGNKNIPGLNGRLVVELSTLDNEVDPSSGAQLRYYEMHQDFTVDAAVAGQGAVVVTDVWGFAPENWSGNTDLLSKIEGHDPIAIGDASGSKSAGMTLTFDDCTRPTPWDSSNKTYTPNAWETGGGGYTPVNTQGDQCLKDHRSVGNVHCTKKGFFGSCGAGDLVDGNNPQDSTWNQPLPPILLSANFSSMEFDPSWGPDRAGNYTAKEGYMQIPNTTPSRTYMRWAGTLDAANSTCQNF